MWTRCFCKKKRFCEFWSGLFTSCQMEMKLCNRRPWKVANFATWRTFVVEKKRTMLVRGVCQYLFDDQRPGECSRSALFACKASFCRWNFSLDFLRFVVVRWISRLTTNCPFFSETSGKLILIVTNVELRDQWTEFVFAIFFRSHFGLWGSSIVESLKLGCEAILRENNFDK